MVGYPQHPWIDTRRAPLLVLTYSAYNRSSRAEMARYLREQETLYEVLERFTGIATEPYAFVVDLSLVDSSAMNRQRAVAYLERVKERGNPNLAGRAFVTPHQTARGVMTAVFWASPPDYPYGFFEQREPALAWARKCLDELRRSKSVSSDRHTRQP